MYTVKKLRDIYCTVMYNADLKGASFAKSFGGSIKLAFLCLDKLLKTT